MDEVFLTAPRYVLGEIKADHATIPNLAELATKFQMAPDAKMWGWGTFHRTERGVEAMAVESGRATLAAAATGPASVDLLVLCSTRFPHGSQPQGDFMQRIMTGLELTNAAFIGVTMHRCANFLTGIQLAGTLVASGRYRRVLVVTTDRIEDEAVRLESFALFCDGAASCLVLGDRSGPGEYELVSSAAAHQATAIGAANEISADLSRQVNDSLLKAADLTLGEVAGLMHNNVFTPIVVMKELQAGFTPAQLYTGNIVRNGHCFAADPIINLVDRDRAGQLHDGGYYILASSVPGTRVGVLLRRLSH